MNKKRIWGFAASLAAVLWLGACAQHPIDGHERMGPSTRHHDFERILERLKLDPKSEALVRGATPGVARSWGSCPANPARSCRLLIDVDAGCPTGPLPEFSDYGVKRGHKIVFVVNSARWSFDARDGIRFKDPNAPFTGGFVSKKVWEVTVAENAAPGYHDYGITLISEEGKPPCHVDPAIWV